MNLRCVAGFRYSLFVIRYSFEVTGFVVLIRSESLTQHQSKVVNNEAMREANLNFMRCKKERGSTKTKVAFLAKAAEAGHLEAQCELAATYQAGSDKDLALEWWICAAERGHKKAQRQAGAMLRQRERHFEAFDMLLRAAKQGRFNFHIGVPDIVLDIVN